MEKERRKGRKVLKKILREEGIKELEFISDTVSVEDKNVSLRKISIILVVVVAYSTLFDSAQLISRLSSIIALIFHIIL